MMFLALPGVGQTDPKRSRLEIIPKAKSSATLYRSGFSVKAREVKMNRSAAVNAYYKNALRFQTKSRSEQPVAPATSASAERSEDTNASSEKLFSNAQITVSSLYPNPANEAVWVEYQLNSGEATLSFSTPLGTKIAEHSLEKYERRLKISTQDIPNGIYFYTLLLDGKTLVTKKLLVRHWHKFVVKQKNPPNWYSGDFFLHAEGFFLWAFFGGSFCYENQSRSKNGQGQKW